MQFRRTAELGWRLAKGSFREMFYHGGHGVEKDLVQAVYCGSEGGRRGFWWGLKDAEHVWNDDARKCLGCDFN